MNYNRPIITLLAVLLLCVSTLARAEPAPVLPDPYTQPPANDPIYNPDPKPTPTNPPPDGLPTTAPNDKPPSKWPIVKENLKKIVKPNALEIGVGVAITGLGALVDYVMDPANNEAVRYPQTGCGYDYSDAIINNRSFQDYPSTVCESQSFKVLETNIYEGFTTYYMQCGDFGIKFWNYCVKIDPKPEEVPQPSPSPLPSPAPDTQPKPVPVPTPALEPDVAPQPQPETQPKPLPSPSPLPSPAPEPSPSPNDKPQDEFKPFELPAFCDWATKVCDFIDWVQDDKLDDNQSDVQIDEKPLTKSASDFDLMYLRFGGQCPAPVTHNLGLNNATFTIDLTPLCQFAILVRPVVLAMAYFLAIGIIANAIRDT